MKWKVGLFLALNTLVLVNSGIIKRHSDVPAKEPTDHEVNNTTEAYSQSTNGSSNSTQGVQETGEKRLKVPDASSRPREVSRQQANQKDYQNALNTKQDESTGDGKSNTAAVQPTLVENQSATNDSKLIYGDDDITKASQEVAEISRLIGKPLTDSHALAMLKGILLEKIHTKLEETKDTTSASSKSTEEGVNKFVAALAASQKKANEKEVKVENQEASQQKLEVHKATETKQAQTKCTDKEPAEKCQYLKRLGLCKAKGPSEVRVRCQLTCGACPDCDGCTTIDCGTICIGYDVAPPPPPPPPLEPPPPPPPVPPPPPPPPPPPYPEPAPPPPPIPPPISPPPPAPVQPAPPASLTLPMENPHPPAEVPEPAHVAAPHVHDPQGHAVATTNAPLAHVHSTAVQAVHMHPTVTPANLAVLPTTHNHLLAAATPQPLVHPVTQPAAPPCPPLPALPPPPPAPVYMPPPVVPPPCKPAAPVCPPCKPEAPTCPPCKPAAPTCQHPKPPVPTLPVATKPSPCVPAAIATIKPPVVLQGGAVAHVAPAAAHPTTVVDEHVHNNAAALSPSPLPAASLPAAPLPAAPVPAAPADSWHHHHHHHATTPQPAVVPHATTPVPHADGGAVIAAAPQQGVAPVVINPAPKVQPTLVAAAGVAVAPPAVDQKCSNPVDIGLVLDSSAGVRGRWGYIKNFARSLIDHFKMGEYARFGVVQFDTIAKFPIRLETYNDAEMLKVHVQKLMMNPFGKRRTDDALKVARDDLFRTARAGVRRAMIIITNGRANGDDPTINWSQMIVEPARELQEAGVEVFVVGVTANAAPEELKIMATEPSTQHVYQVPTFDQMHTVVEPIATRICHGWTSVINAQMDGIHLTLGGSVSQPIAGQLYRPTGPYGCEVKYAKIGCYSDDGNSPRPLPEELFTDHSPTSSVFTGRHVDYDHWDQYLPSIVCRCAKMADQKGYRVFGVQLFGSCWAGPQAGQTYAVDGEADQEMCISFGFKKCTPTDNVCVGKQQTNFVYTFDDESKRSHIPRIW